MIAADELHALQHALRQVLAALPLDAVEAEPRQQACGARRRLVLGDALQLRDVGEEVADAHLPVDAALFRQVADAILGLERRRAAEHRQLAGVREEDRHDHADAGRLPRAARTDDAVGGAARHDEIEIVDRPRRAERLRHAAQAQRSDSMSGPFGRRFIPRALLVTVKTDAGPPGCPFAV